ncbi:hypothetical protein, partial [Sphingobium phenoxybenzoativorans]|uniref:hypothetical protein n=1 Tax=Sphingobium phenoxybenzoativorans TaxID=1592790 RepID=UPI001C0BE516
MTGTPSPPPAQGWRGLSRRRWGWIALAAILLAAGLAMLATCRERPAPPKPVAHKPPAPPV